MTGRSTFSRIYQVGVRRRRGDVMVVSAPGAPGIPQAGVVVGRRVGSAVRRNRAKRRLREALDRVPLADGTAYIVVAGPAVADVEFEQLVTWLSGAVSTDLPPSEEEPA